MAQATQNDIEAWFKVLRETASAVAGSERDPKEREVIVALAETGLRIAESIVTDLNLIAYQLGQIEQNTRR